MHAVLSPAPLPASTEGTRMFAEAHEAATAVERQLHENESAIAALAQRLRASPPRFIVTSARGSSDHAATFAKYVFETRLGLVTASASPSVSSVYAAPQDLRDSLYLAISQSGKSPDLVRQAQAAKRSGAHVVALVNTVDSPLAAAADETIALHAGPELSVAATKSYICSLSAIIHLASTWNGDAVMRSALQTLPSVMRAAWPLDWSALSDALVDARNLFVIGRGVGLGVAQEAALKFKETCGLHAEAFSAAEVRHGPMAIVDAGFPVLFLVQDDEARAGTLEVAEEFRARGARVFVAMAGASSPGILPTGPSLHPVCAPLVAIQNFYRAVNVLALRRGRNPDVPPHLNKVTETL